MKKAAVIPCYKVSDKLLQLLSRIPKNIFDYIFATYSPPK